MAFDICTSFDAKYFDWGYALVCSIANNYRQNTYVMTYGLTEKQENKVRRIPGVTLDGRKDTGVKNYGFWIKPQLCNWAIQDTKATYLFFIDSDSLVEASLDKFYKFTEENPYDLATHCRFYRNQDETNFCSNNVVFNVSDKMKKFVNDWEVRVFDSIPKYKTYSEQASLWVQYDKDKESVKLFDLEEYKDLPIFHAKGSKYSFHKDFKKMRYTERCLEQTKQIKKELNK